MKLTIVASYKLILGPYHILYEIFLFTLGLIWAVHIPSKVRTIAATCTSCITDLFPAIIGVLP